MTARCRKEMNAACRIVVGALLLGAAYGAYWFGIERHRESLQQGRVVLAEKRAEVEHLRAQVTHALNVLTASSGSTHRGSGVSATTTSRSLP